MHLLLFTMPSVAGANPLPGPVIKIDNSANLARLYDHLGSLVRRFDESRIVSRWTLGGGPAVHLAVSTWPYVTFDCYLVRLDVERKGWETLAGTDRTRLLENVHSQLYNYDSRRPAYQNVAFAVLIADLETAQVIAQIADTEQRTRCAGVWGQYRFSIP
ncbi:hypothetical protein [Gloeobacter violaceus]|uniref:hypothetical protein n=1 Tax=Gloeobacter violaceus TaxID=33072 RepID=UPI0013E8C5C4|nr:hypothetical protein [Gloeobacter violaceus]